MRETRLRELLTLPSVVICSFSSHVLWPLVPIPCRVPFAVFTADVFDMRVELFEVANFSLIPV